MTDSRKRGTGRALRLDHVGIAVKSLAERYSLFLDLVVVSVALDLDVRS